MRIPSTHHQPTINPGGGSASELPAGEDLNQHLSAETDVSDGLADVSAHALDDLPQDGPLNFNDGDISHPRGDTRRMGASWAAQGSDKGQLNSPSEGLPPRSSDEP